jgi:hypothetical protein
MDAPEILRALREARDLPKAALIAASEHRGEMTPLLLRELEAFLAAPSADSAHLSSVFFAFHLLGEWRESSAYRPLARLLRLPPDVLDEVLGDALDTNCRRIMAAVFDGDPQPLFEIVLDEDAHEFARSAACEAIAMLTLSGEIKKPVAERFLRDAYTQIRPQRECFVWWGWQTAIAVLGLTDLRDLVAKAFRRGFINKIMMRFSEFEEDLRHALEHPADPWSSQGDARSFSGFGSTVEELSNWNYYDPATESEQALARNHAIEDAFPKTEGGYWSQPRLKEPRVSLFAKVGRNDPCPCGSGKKYKKCCMRVGT